jgi:hypothetical protein
LIKKALAKNLKSVVLAKAFINAFFIPLVKTNGNSKNKYLEENNIA